MNNFSGIKQNCFEHIHVPLLVVDKNKIVVLANKSFSDLFSKHSFEGKLIDECFEATRKNDELILPEIDQQQIIERRMIDSKDVCQTFEITVKKLDSNNGAYYLFTFLNLDRVTKADQTLADMAFKDMLTGCFNRNYMNTMFNMDSPTPWGITLYFMDLDKFKHINDYYGHSVGDEVLQGFAHRLNSITRDSDKLIRMGGDEFCLISFKFDENFEQVCLKIIGHVSSLFETAAGKFSISCSIGVVRSKQGESNFNSILAKADQAMYEAKSSQYQRFKEFNHSDHQSNYVSNLELLQDLKLAIEQKEFYCVFQPVFNRNHEIVTLEALSRWYHPKIGLVSPGRFIQLAADNKLLGLLEHLIFCNVIEFLKNLSERDILIPIQVNVTSEWISEKINIENVLGMLSDVELTQESIILEVTENSVYTDSTFIMIDDLVKAGHRIYIDDFGTGFSNLKAIKNSTAQVIKFDRSLVVDQSGDLFTKHLVDACKIIGKEVLFEGVETKEEFELSLSQGADYIQGFYLSKPLSAESTINLLLTK